MKIGVISDSHWKDSIGYSDLFEDGREEERAEVLNAVALAFRDCNTIVFNGDNLNSKNNSSKTIAAFTEFLMSFKDKNIIVNSGNHEKFGDGAGALDFLGALVMDSLRVVTKKPRLIVGHGVGMVVCPYFHLSELGVETYDEGVVKVLSMLPEGDILFVHHAISGGSTYSGISTDLFHEIVLPKEELEKRYKLVIGGHIHQPQNHGKTWVVGSTFTNEVGDFNKRVLVIDTDTLAVKSYPLPGRPIIKLVDPTVEEVGRLSINSIVKVIITKPQPFMGVEQIKVLLEKFPAHMLIEQIPDERKKVNFEEGMLDFSIDNLLEIYCTEKKVDIDKLKHAISLL